MKILVVQDYLRSGGTERQSIRLTRAFAAAGHRASLLTFRPGGALTAELAGLAHASLTRVDFGLDWFAPGLTRAVAAAAPDLVLCMGRMANCYAGFLQSHFPRAAVVGTMRTGKPLPFLFRRSLRRVRHVVANSAAARATLVARHGVSADRVTVIPNALVHPPDATVAPNPELRAQLGAAESTLVLLNVAMFRPEKNQAGLIELCGRLPPDLDWQLWLAGDGPTRSACERLAAGRAFGGRVKLLGLQADPRPLYRAADLAVLASHSESLSNFLCEAQAHGLPAVAWDVVGVGECFIPGESGLLVPHRHEEAFLGALQRLANEPETRRRFAARARAYATAAFDPARQVQAHLDLFARLVAPAA
jgi:glycosyltransferase involved in cell wall biosynthesis